MFGIGIMMAALLAGAEPADKLDLALREHAREEKLAGTPWRDESADLYTRLKAANVRESKAWLALKGKDDWEKYRDVRIEALRASLGRFPEPPHDLKMRVRKTLEGDGFRIDNITFESRPGLVVTANLYRPAKPGKAMPGVLIIHSHHNPKTQGELQDMGAMWAKAGCLVLIMDQLGHGERRQHPFRTAGDYPKTYRPSRQDYYFRYNLAVQLQTIGDSLIGWMVWDLRRGVDLLLSRPGIDAKKIILLGSVAGGGDPAAVTAALDQRIAAVAPFNFGGPQPETRFPLPPDAETSVNFSGSGSWESTRNLARSIKDGFLPWVIVGAAAPRRHIYAHEFAWDQKRDPVWKRLEKIHGWYGSLGHLTSVHGSGSVRGTPPEATHCNNIGPVHRKGIHEALKKWFDIGPVVEKSDRRPVADLLCLDKDERPKMLHELAAEIGAQRVAATRIQLATPTPEERRRQLRARWAKVLGDVEPPRATGQKRTTLGNLPEQVKSELLTIATESKAGAASVLLLRPAQKPGTRLPVIVLIGQGGRQAFLQKRSQEIATLLRGGSAVALAGLGGMSTLPIETSRERVSSSTGAASTALMLGDPALAGRLRELRIILRALRDLPELDPKRISLWGDSFAPANAPGTIIGVPLELPQPKYAEPLGGVLALLCGLFEEGIVSIRARGGLIGYQSLLESPFCLVPYDAIVPGALTAGDLSDVVAALAPTPVRLEALVNGRNQAATAKERERILAGARKAYRDAKAAEKLRVED